MGNERYVVKFIYKCPNFLFKTKSVHHFFRKDIVLYRNHVHLHIIIICTIKTLCSWKDGKRNSIQNRRFWLVLARISLMRDGTVVGLKLRHQNHFLEPRTPRRRNAKARNCRTIEQLRDRVKTKCPVPAHPNLVY